MKIPTSSSILLATLAITSSSTSLAAPTGQANTEGDLTSSQSNSHLPSEGTDGNIAGRSMGGNDLEARGNGMVSDILAGLPIVGPLAKALLVKDCPNPDGPSTQSADGGVSQDELARLQSAVDTVSGALNGVLPISVPVPLPTGAVGDIVSMIPAPDPVKSAIAGVADTEPTPSSDSATSTSDLPGPTETVEAGVAGADDNGDTNTTPDAAATTDAGSSFLISPTTTIANAEEAGETPAATTTDAVPNGEETTTPSGPPNTPAMPETTPDVETPDQGDQDDQVQPQK